MSINIFEKFLGHVKWIKILFWNLRKFKCFKTLVFHQSVGVPQTADDAIKLLVISKQIFFLAN